MRFFVIFMVQSKLDNHPIESSCEICKCSMRRFLAYSTEFHRLNSVDQSPDNSLPLGVIVLGNTFLYCAACCAITYLGMGRGDAADVG